MSQITCWLSISFIMQSTKFTVHPVWEENGLGLKGNETISFRLNKESPAQIETT